MTRSTSVIIPCYNGERYLREALESVRAQTVPVLEIIVVDDGSAIPITRPEGWTEPPLYIIRTPNRGLGAARNMGLKHATGEFVAFLDADDFWHAGKVAAQEKALRADAQAVACYTRCVKEPGFFGFGPYPPPDVGEDEFLLVLWYSQFFPPSAVMARREAVEAAGPFGERFGNGEDIEMWMRLLTRGNFVQVPEPLCYYRQHPGQITQDPYKRVAGGKQARAAVIARHSERLIRAGLRPDRLWDAYRNDVLLVYYRRQFNAARRLLWNYWREHPLDLPMFYRALVSLLPACLVAWLRGRIESPAISAAPAIEAITGPDPGWRQRVRQLTPVLHADLSAARS